MLPPDCAPSSIPDGAEDVLEETLTSEHWPTEYVYSCRVGGEVMGYRRRRGDGRVVWERGWRDDAPNGWEREWDRDGLLTFESFRIDGAEHGVARQWNGGRLIGWYIMDHGTGLDLWRDHDGSLSEDRYYKDGKLHGSLRWWFGQSNTTIWWEEHFHEGVPHGIERQWNGADRLKRGYPKYWVQGRQVTKRRYLRAAIDDPTLPPFGAEDNRPERPLPPEYAATMPPATPPRFDPETGTITQ